MAIHRFSLGLRLFKHIALFPAPLFVSLIALVQAGCGGATGTGGGAQGPEDKTHQSQNRSGLGEKGSGKEGGNMGRGNEGDPCTIEKPCKGQGRLYYCRLPGPRAVQCGTRPRDLCRTDADCSSQGPAFICKMGHGLCGGRGCAPGCKKDADCAEYETCRLSTHRCETKTCSSAKDCPDNFKCVQGKCDRKRCTKSSECEGYCVHKGCYPHPGVCTKPPPPIP